MSSREGYRISGNTVQELKISLNFFLQSIADRLDKIEGVRGTSTVESNLNLSGNSLINVGNFDQNLGTADSPRFGGLTIDGDLAVTGDLEVTGDLVIDSLTVDNISGEMITISDENNTIVHQLGDST